MPRPATLTDAIDLVRKSGLLDDGAVKEFVARTKRNGFGGLTPEALFARMVGDELLTPFQARQLTEGRWRGLVLGNYHLKARIGRGGMGQVFRGEHCKLRRPVAIKVLNTDLADDPIANARLVREARATGALDHPNIVKIYDLAAEHSPPYLVMEYVDGLSLQAIVALTGTLSIEATALCGRQIALGLAHAAEAGFVHRDIKPANLLLDRSGVVKILDLGIVLLREEAVRLTLAPDGQSTILGTVDYLAPEQALDSHAVDGRADIYALGGTLYFLLAGHPPFDEGGPELRLRHKQSSEPPPIHHLRPDVPEALSAAITRMLARDPADRFQMALDVADTLDPWAVPVAGFPEDLFARVPGGDASGEFQSLSKIGVHGDGPTPRSRINAYGSSVHPSLSMTLSAVLSPADLGMPTARSAPVEIAVSSADTPSPQSLLSQPERSLPAEAATEPNVIVRNRALPALRRGRGGYSLIAALCLLAVILCGLIAWAIGLFASPVGARAPHNRAARVAEVGSPREDPLIARRFLH